MNLCGLFSTAYLPPIAYYMATIQYSSIVLEKQEHFIKQSYRSRCDIYGVNGKLSLIIPLKKRKNKTLTKDIQISYEHPWQNLHWRSFEAAYRSSPYFEYYEDDLIPFYQNRKNNFLIDFNQELFEKINQLLKLEISIKWTEEYLKETKECNDHRNLAAKKHPTSLNAYPQVFESKHGFLNNLSIIDLLFNEGPGSVDYLKSSR